MTHTTEIEYHRDRPLIHFGSPPDLEYWRKPEEEPKSVRYVARFRKKGIR